MPDQVNKVLLYSSLIKLKKKRERERTTNPQQHWKARPDIPSAGKDTQESQKVLREINLIGSETQQNREVHSL